MSPVAMWTPPNRSTMRPAWVPLPDAGGPTRTMRIARASSFSRAGRHGTTVVAGRSRHAVEAQLLALVVHAHPGPLHHPLRRQVGVGGVGLDHHHLGLGEGPGDQ